MAHSCCSAKAYRPKILKQNLTAMPNTIFSTISLFFTLFGLLGSLFAIHLSNWFREILSLKQKYEINRTQDTDVEKSALRECRYKLRELYNPVTWIVYLLLTVFLVFVLWRGALLISPYWDKDMLAQEVRNVAIGFLTLYTALSLFFLIGGYWICSSLKKNLR